MKILLLGEYNSSHYTLKEGLKKLGHDVLVVGNGDGFKKRFVDINFKVRFNSGFSYYIKRIIYELLKIDITSVCIKYQFNTHKNKFKNYDIVQLINESPFGTIPKTETKLLKYIFDHNFNVFLLSCGTDYVSVKYADEGKFRYSILTPFYEKRGTKKEFQHALMYLTSPYVKLHKYVYKNIKGIIASDFDYHLPLIENKKYLGLAPNPINIEKIKYIDLEINDKIIIFHGINEKNYHKKGNDIFEKALNIILKKHASAIKIITAKSLPYNEYINAFDKAHILLDQVFAYDQGFNALEAMAKGKVVFTGAEKEWLNYYNLEEDTIAINALPDEHQIASKLEWLILNPGKILEISVNARRFIEREHDYISCANIYLNKWKSRL